MVELNESAYDASVSNGSGNVSSTFTEQRLAYQSSSSKFECSDAHTGKSSSVRFADHEEILFGDNPNRAYFSYMMQQKKVSGDDTYEEVLSRQRQTAWQHEAVGANAAVAPNVDFVEYTEQNFQQQGRPPRPASPPDKRLEDYQRGTEEPMVPPVPQVVVAPLTTQNLEASRKDVPSVIFLGEKSGAHITRKGKRGGAFTSNDGTTSIGLSTWFEQQRTRRLLVILLILLIVVICVFATAFLVIALTTQRKSNNPSPSSNSGNNFPTLIFSPTAAPSPEGYFPTKISPVPGSATAPTAGLPTKGNGLPTPDRAPSETAPSMTMPVTMPVATASPSATPTAAPIIAPTPGSEATTSTPTRPPSRFPTISPTPSPITAAPTPTPYPTQPPVPGQTPAPTPLPTPFPTRMPTPSPTPFPTPYPTTGVPTALPTPPPSLVPTPLPTVTPEFFISTDKSSYQPSEEIIVDFINKPPRADDWVGVFPSGVSTYTDTNFNVWKRACGTRLCEVEVSEGMVSFATENTGVDRWPLPPGTYQVHLFYESEPPFTAYASSGSFVVEPEPTPPPTPVPTPPPTPSPTAVPIPSPTPRPTNGDLAALRLLLETVSPDNGAALNTDGTPQDQAAKWLADDPSYSTYSVQKKVQRYALATFYYSTNGAKWNNRNNWMEYAVDECSWHTTYGDPSQVCSNGVFKKLDLQVNNLGGTLPNELKLLSNLDRLFLLDNDIGGAIPSEIGDLGLLERLILTRNSLVGGIPATLGNLERLIVLGLGRNGLSGRIPADLGNLDVIDTIGLERNSFSGPIPSQLGNLDSLELLAVDYNNLDGNVPTELSQLNNLRGLSIQKNDITGPIPSGLCALDVTIRADCLEVSCPDSCCDECYTDGDEI